MHENPSNLSRASSGEAGFTLAEALVAVLILAVGLMAVTNLMVVSASSNVAANQGTAAATAASEALEALKSLPFGHANLVAGGDLDSDQAPYFRNDEIPGVGMINTRWVVVDVDTQTKFLRVRSEGRGSLGGPRTRAEFTTFRSCTAVAIGCPGP